MNYDQIRQLVCEHNSFFHDSIDCTLRRSICVDAKLLIALKYLAYGTAINAFRDYFQMGESTSRLCVTNFVTTLLRCRVLTEKYLRKMSPSDARRVEKLHSEVHGVRGMAFSIDCSHIFWDKCPIAHQGQYKGKEGSPTIVIEAGCDYHLWFWHCVFGYVGSMNDINIWDCSKLHESLQDGSFELNDFGFDIAGQQFSKLWFLVDGIYPEISRFVKTITEPTNNKEALFSLWQEAKRKDIERGFGVLKRKFAFLTTPVKMFFVEDISDVVYSCFLLHNMAVEERLKLDDEFPESADFYDCINEINNGTETPFGTLSAMAFVAEENAACSERRLEIDRLSRMGIDIFDASLSQRSREITILDVTTRLAHHRWKDLYNFSEHKRLQCAIIEELSARYLSYANIN
jgi:hypothetical protein